MTIPSCDLSEVAAFGDDINDVEMLRECGFGVGMRNAIEECKNVADFLCDDCDEDGVAQMIKHALAGIVFGHLENNTRFISTGRDYLEAIKPEHR